jgi:hypothetical protein
MIGIARRILDSMLSELPSKRLTHEVLSTLMAEITAIVNNRTLIPVSNDPEAPEILTPSTLLTQKPTALTATPGQFTSKDLHTAQWRQVQYLAISGLFGGKNSYPCYSQDENGNASNPIVVSSCQAGSVLSPPPVL